MHSLQSCKECKILAYSMVMRPNQLKRGAAPEGLRLRKQRETRQRIARAGLRMFLEKGFDATTLDMIAAAADISRRTFFHYFQSKDAVLAAWESDVEEAFRAAIASQPQQISPVAVLRGALMSVISRYA